MKRSAQAATTSVITMRVLIENCEKLAEGELPITSPVCFVVWHDVHQFTAGDFDTESGKGSFVDTSLTEITIDQLPRAGSRISAA